MTLERTLRETSEVLKVPHHKILDKVKQLNDDLMQRAKEIRLLKSEQIKTQKLSIMETLERMEEQNSDAGCPLGRWWLVKGEYRQNQFKVCRCFRYY